jgi:folate-binding protein YgfZ
VTGVPADGDSPSPPPGPPGQPGPAEWPAPPSHGCGPDEFRCLDAGCVAIEAAWETLVEISGDDAASFLHSLLTQEIVGMRDGEVRPAALADRKGHWLADLSVLRAGPRFLVRVRRDRAPALLAVLDRHLFSSRVTWQVASPGGSSLLLLGPGAAPVMRVITGVAVDPGDGAPAGGPLEPSADGPAWWMIVRDTKPSGILLHGSAADLVGVRRAFQSCLPGAPDLREAGPAAFNLARIAAGTPWYGLDGDDGRLVPEVLPNDRVSLVKGCFLGQETIARLHHRGQLRRRLVRASIATSSVPAPGDGVIDGDGAPAGEVRSASIHPDGHVLALVMRHEPVRGAMWRLSAGEEVTWTSDARSPDRPPGAEEP